MSLKLSDYIDNPAALTQQYKRPVTFRITPIGGPNEIIAWRAEQAKKLAALNLKREELKQTQIDKIAPDAPLGELTWQGKVLLSDPEAWNKRLRIARERRKEYHKPQILTHLEQPKAVNLESDTIEKPRLGLKEMVISWGKKLWASANF